MGKFIKILLILGISIDLFGAKEVQKRNLNNFDIAVMAYQQNDYFKAAEFFEKVCQEGNLSGCSNLGYLNDQGYGVRQNYEKAIELYTKACDGKIGSACFNLGAMYIDESNDIAPSFFIRQKKAQEFMGRGCDFKDFHSCEMYSLLNKVFSNPAVKTRIEEMEKSSSLKPSNISIEESINLAKVPYTHKETDGTKGIVLDDIRYGNDPLYLSKKQYNLLKTRKMIIN